jgi:hypothetical protein
MMLVSFLLAVVVVLPAVLAGENKWGVGKLPAMGWNSWNAYNCDITEKKFMSAAEKIVELGLKVWLHCGLFQSQLPHFGFLNTNKLTRMQVTSM